VYLKYARRFLDPKQIDTIDWHRVPGVSAELAEFLSAREREDAAETGGTTEMEGTRARGHEGT
jgi:hypothetical protein